MPFVCVCMPHPIYIFQEFVRFSQKFGKNMTQVEAIHTHIEISCKTCLSRKQEIVN
jgi:hypothetical protein